MRVSTESIALCELRKEEIERILHEDLLVHDGLRIQQWSREIIMQLKNSSLSSHVIDISALLVFVVMLVSTNLPHFQAYKSVGHAIMYSTHGSDSKGLCYWFMHLLYYICFIVILECTLSAYENMFVVKH